MKRDRESWLMLVIVAVLFAAVALTIGGLWGMFLRSVFYGSG